METVATYIPAENSPNLGVSHHLEEMGTGVAYIPIGSTHTILPYICWYNFYTLVRWGCETLIYVLTLPGIDPGSPAWQRVTLITTLRGWLFYKNSGAKYEKWKSCDSVKSFLIIKAKNDSYTHTWFFLPTGSGHRVPGFGGKVWCFLALKQNGGHFGGKSAKISNLGQRFSWSS